MCCHVMIHLQIVGAEADMEATEAVALEGVEVSAGVTVEASEEVAATKWEEGQLETLGSYASFSIGHYSSVITAGRCIYFVAWFKKWRFLIKSLLS